MFFKKNFELIANIILILFVCFAIVYFNIWVYVVGIICLITLSILISAFLRKNDPLNISENDPELIWIRKLENDLELQNSKKKDTQSNK